MAVVVVSVHGELDLSISEIVEDLSVQELGPQAGVKAFNFAIHPGRSRLDEAALGSVKREPDAQRAGDELRPIV